MPKAYGLFVTSESPVIRRLVRGRISHNLSHVLGDVMDLIFNTLRRSPVRSG
jgi:hypothetical protein